MRAIFLTMTFDPEPGAHRGLPLARWLRERGYDVKVVTGFPQYPRGKMYPGYQLRPWQREVMDGVPVLRVPLYPSHDASALRRSWTYLSFMLSASTVGASLIGSADLVFVCELTPAAGTAALVLKALYGIPLVCHVADLWPESVLGSGMLESGTSRRLAGRALGAWCGAIYRRSDVITALSPGFRRLLIERGVPEQKVEISYNWTDETVYRPVPRDESLARELGMQGRFNFVYAGNLGRLQGVDTIVRAAASLRDTRPDLQVVFIGSGPAESEVRKLAAELGATNVRFFPRREFWEMPQIYSLADVSLVHLRDLPFLAATIPSKTQVLLASGRPVLMAVRGDAASIVANARAGVVCPPERPDEMAAAMVRLAATPASELEEMGRRGRQYYLDHMSLEIAGRQMDEIFRRVVGASSVAHRRDSRRVGRGLASELDSRPSRTG